MRKRKHEVVWLSEEEALKLITHEYNRIGILRYLEKDNVLFKKVDYLTPANYRHEVGEGAA